MNGSHSSKGGTILTTDIFSSENYFLFPEEILHGIQHSQLDLRYAKVTRVDPHQVQVDLLWQDRVSGSSQVWLGIQVTARHPEPEVVLPPYLRVLPGPIQTSLGQLVGRLGEAARGVEERSFVVPVSAAPEHEDPVRAFQEREAIVPFMSPTPLFITHAQRYAFATEFCRGKTVLDLACGTGYGSKILSRVATRVIGADYDETTLRYASRFYSAPNIRHVAMHAGYLPLTPRSVDTVVSFETIEHLPPDEVPRFLREVQQLVRRDGIFICSTPNKRLASDRDIHYNGHQCEMYLDQFRQLLTLLWAEVELFSQSPFEQEGDLSGSAFPVTEGASEDSEFFIAVCKAPRIADVVKPVSHPVAVTTRPRVLFVAEYFYPHVGGAEHTANTVLQRLARSGHPVAAICRGPEGTRASVGLVPVSYVASGDELRQRMAEFNPDLVLTQVNWAPVVTQVAHELGKPVMLSVMSYEHFCPAPVVMQTCDRICGACPYYLQHRDVMAAQEAMLREVDAIYCNATYTRDVLKEFSGRDGDIWYQPMEYDGIYRAESDPKARRYITMVTAAPYKGLLVFAEIAKRMPDQEFLIVGRGDPKACGVDPAKIPNLTVWGNVDPRELYAVAKILLVPSIWPEPFPRVIMEAQANGVPVIASATGGIPECVGEGGLLVHQFTNPDAWVEQIRTLLRAPGLCRYLVESADERCRRWEADRQMPWLEAKIQELASAGTAVPAKQVGLLWEGSFFVHHSLATINMEVTRQLVELGIDLGLAPYEPAQFPPTADPRYPLLAHRLGRRPDKVDIHVRHKFPPDFTPPAEGRYVLMQPWEFGSLPVAWVEGIRNVVDEVWAISEYVKECYVKSGVPAEKVVVTSPGVDPDRFKPEGPSLVLPTAKRFRFLFVGGTIPRKGYDLLINAYLEEFTSDDDVSLVIKDQAYYRQKREADLEELRRGRPRSPEILYLYDDLMPAQLPELYRAAHCYVHPYRGEGFGMPIVEAMACGLPVIVTDYGPSRDYCSVETAYLVPAEEVRFPEKLVGELETVDYPRWVEPDLQAVRRWMRYVYEHQEEARSKGVKASEHVRSHFTWRQMAERIRERCLALKAAPPRAQRERSSSTLHPAIQLAVELVQEGRGEEAVKVLTPVIRSSSSSAEAWNAMGCARIQCEEYDEAERCFLKALSIQPGFVPAQRNLGDVSFLRKEWAHAITWYERVLQSRADDQEVLLRLTDSYFHLGVYEAATLGYQALLKKDPGLEAAGEGLRRVQAACADRVALSNSPREFASEEVPQAMPVPVTQDDAAFRTTLLSIVKPYSLLSDERLTALYQIATLLETHQVPGSLAEFGVCNGGSAGVISAVAHRFNSGRQTWLFDSFEGMPAPGELDVAHNGDPGRKGMTRGDEVNVRELLFGKLKVESRDIHIVKGWFDATLPPRLKEIGPIALLHVDCDWYDPVKFCFEQLYDQVVPGGFIVIDDYGHWKGARKAVDEFLAERNLKVNLVTIDYTGVFFQKPLLELSERKDIALPDSTLAAARSLLEGQRYEDARRLFGTLLEKCPTSAGIWNDLGCAEMLAGDLEAAEQSFKKAVSLGLSNGAAKGNLASLYVALGRFLEAIDLLEQILTSHPDVDTLLDLADCYRQMGAEDSARLGYEQVLKVAPGHPRAVAGLSGISS